MKTPQLIRGVRLLFGFLRGLSACFIVLMPVALLLPSTTLSFRNVPFKADVKVVAKAGPSAEERYAEIVELTGELKLKTMTDQDRSAYRLIVTVPSLVLMFFFFGLFHLIWRVCRNVENGEVFNLTNVKLIRNMGLLLMVFSLMSFLTGVWMRSHTLQYVGENFIFNGVEFQPSDLDLGTSFLRFALSPMMLGLLVLCLAEVFRQGQQLKQEAELTV